MRRLELLLPALALLSPMLASAQIDPVKRDLIQLGYNQALQGHAPFAGYAFYYHNQPNFVRTNLTLRVALAPVYLDSELGVSHGLGPHTDFAIGLAGGGFADSYNEIHGGTYYPSQSFEGSDGEISASIYHLFNPADEIPLNLVVRGTAHYIAYANYDGTAPNFQLPSDHDEFSVRTGLRWGGVEPVLLPALAMELSIWYQGAFRTDSGAYGFNGDRELNPNSHLFWTEAALSYTLPKSHQNFSVRLTSGTSLNADRFSAYRLGGYLPLVSEFPLTLPGYYYQEISADQFVLLNASYLVPLNKSQRWSLHANVSSAFVDYLTGEGQPGNWLNGVGGGILYRSPTDRLKIMFTCGYGVDAIRSDGRGAESIGVLMEWNLGKAPAGKFSPTQPNRWRGWQWLLGD
ncbi:MAG TPA: hypothetical protein VFY06_03900 [Verrucomicrobiae bacterium]|nr:hypothetical protein [Verrucomicrobiae bacterium]